MKLVISVFIISLLSFNLFGCATIMSGYEDKVEIVTSSDEIKVYTKDGVEIPVNSKYGRTYSEIDDEYLEKEIKTIQLRKNKPHILLIKSGEKENLVEVYPKIGSGWFVLDFVTGILPGFVDAYTGGWNYFEPIKIDF